mgnify:FL=1
MQICNGTQCEQSHLVYLKNNISIVYELSDLLPSPFGYQACMKPLEPLNLI